MKLPHFVCAAIITITTLGGLSPATAEMPEGDYLYSSLCIGPWGYAIGHSVLLEYRKSGSYVTAWVPSIFGVEKLYGDIGEPPEFDVKTGSLFFPYQNHDDDYDFNGIVTEDHLEGLFGDNSFYEVLPRVAEIKEPAKCDPAHMPPYQ